jgi:hypothetical protein
MVQAPQSTTFSGPAFIRLLARLTDGDVPEPGQSLSDRLSQWLHWTDAIALSTALNDTPPAVASRAQADGHAEEKEYARVRSALTNVVAGEKRRGHRRALPEETSTDAEIDYAAFRQRYLSLQQTMSTDIGTLRARLRRGLAAGTPGMARLAALDAVMERALGPREHGLLATVPALLGRHFQRLREAGQEQPADNGASVEMATATPAAWLDVFRKDMQSVLLAELDVRLQPVEGLLAALCTR